MARAKCIVACGLDSGSRGNYEIVERNVGGFHFASLASGAMAGTLSFKEWKGRRVAEKTSVIRQVERERSMTGSARDNKLAQARFNLQTEQDLTPEDYFHLYLMEQFRKNPNQARETAKSLSKEELADIVVSYINATNQFYEIETSASRLQTSR